MAAVLMMMGKEGKNAAVYRKKIHKIGENNRNLQLLANALAMLFRTNDNVGML